MDTVVVKSPGKWRLLTKEGLFLFAMLHLLVFISYILPKDFWGVLIVNVIAGTIALYVAYEFRKREIVKDLAHQVAHDIRSPLSALQMVASVSKDMPDRHRNLLRQATERVENITADLSSHHTNSKCATGVLKCPVLMAPLIREIVTEKVAELGHQENVEMVEAITEDAEDLYAMVSKHEFKRVLSNLINNAYEAITDKGRVTVKIKRQVNDVVISVTDNGKGISPAELSKIGRRGVSFGKSIGSGLGIYHATKVVENWCGQIKLESKEGKGTTVKISLPSVLNFRAPEGGKNKLSELV